MTTQRRLDDTADREPVLPDDVRAALITAATAARGLAYAPYSHFAVGAALQAADGTVFTGCNVENASYGLTICAERNAVAHAVATGVRVFTAVAVVTENGTMPCGACRQVLAEFGPHMWVIAVDAAGRQSVVNLDDLLPAAFLPGDLPRNGSGAR